MATYYLHTNPLKAKQKNQLLPPQNQTEEATSNSEQKEKIKARIEELDDEMNQTFGILYQIWLGFVALLACSSFAFSIFHFIFKDGIDGIMSNLHWIGAMIYSLWILHQCHLLRKAMKKSDLKSADNGLMSMYCFAIVHLILMIWVLISFGPKNIIVIVLSFCFSYILPTGLNVWGGRRVKRMLEEKEALDLKLEVANGVRRF